MFRNFVPSTEKNYHCGFPKVVAQSTLQKEQCAAPLIFLISKKRAKMLKQIGISTNDIYQ